MAQSKEKIIKKLNHKYRLVLIDDSSFKEKSSIKLNALNVLLLSSLLFVIITSISMLLFAYTPLGNVFNKTLGLGADKEILLNTDKYLNKIIERNEINIERQKQLKLILSGEASFEDLEKEIETLPIPEEKTDSAEPDIKDKSKKGELTLNESIRRNEFLLYSPIKGFVTRPFNVRFHHGVDVAPSKFDGVHVIQDGVVVFASWTPDFGHVIGVQHNDNLISFYKHNSVLHKKVGTFVTAGEAIAIVGNSGELTSGKHLHLELWENGRALDPQDFITF
jgi:murein DD-endopeptidase MepM/ murein hydrolase activator NlpD